MAASPTIVLAICIPTLVFQAMFVGAVQGEPEFPAFSTSSAVCNGSSFVDAISCPFYWIVDLFRVIVAGAAYFFGLLTFNVPGAPWFIRVVVSSLIGGPTVWAIVTLVRGN